MRRFLIPALLAVLLIPATALANAEESSYREAKPPSTPHHSSPYQPQAQPGDEERARAERRQSVLIFLPLGAVLITVVLVLTVKRGKSQRRK